MSIMSTELSLMSHHFSNPTIQKDPPNICLLLIVEEVPLNREDGTTPSDCPLPEPLVKKGYSRSGSNY